MSSMQRLVFIATISCAVPVSDNFLSLDCLAKVVVSLACYYLQSVTLKVCLTRLSVQPVSHRASFHLNQRYVNIAKSRFQLVLSRPWLQVCLLSPPFQDVCHRLDTLLSKAFSRPFTWLSWRIQTFKVFATKAAPSLN